MCAQIWESLVEIKFNDLKMEQIYWKEYSEWQFWNKNNSDNNSV